MHEFLPRRHEQMDMLHKGAAEIIRVADLRERLEESRKTGRPLRIKAGFDPTAPDLHLGHTLLLRKLRRLQQLGHLVIFLVGDFTSLIGVPSCLKERHPQGTQPRADRRIRQDLSGAGLQGSRSCSHRSSLQLREGWLGKLGYRGDHLKSGLALHRLANA